MNDKEQRDLVQGMRDATAQVAFAALDIQSKLDEKLSREDLKKFEARLEKRLALLRGAIEAADRQLKARAKAQATAQAVESEEGEAPIKRGLGSFEVNGGKFFSR